jgi:hypothetical protein
VDEPHKVEPAPAAVLSPPSGRYRPHSSPRWHQPKVACRHLSHKRAQRHHVSGNHNLGFRWLAGGASVFPGTRGLLQKKVHDTRTAHHNSARHPTAIPSPIRFRNRFNWPIHGRTCAAQAKKNYPPNFFCKFLFTRRAYIRILSIAVLCRKSHIPYHMILLTLKILDNLFFFCA